MNISTILIKHYNKLYKKYKPQTTMLNRKEITVIIISTIILGFTLTVTRFSLENFLYAALAVFLVIIINTFAKKVVSYHLDSEIEVKFWEMQQFGFRKHWKFKRPFAIGAFFPFITTVLSQGYFNWMATLAFDVKPKVYRAARRHGLYTFSEMTEYHLALIAAAGIFANFLFAIIGYFLNFHEFARLNIYFALFNIIPLSELDGNKIFFGSLTLWSFLATIILILVAGLILIA